MFAVPAGRPWAALTEDQLAGFDTESPGGAIEDIVYAFKDQITGPPGLAINVRVLRSEDPDMVLIEVSETEEPRLSHNFYGVEWDRIAPREMLLGSVEADHVGLILQAVVDEANRVLTAMGRAS